MSAEPGTVIAARIVREQVLRKPKLPPDERAAISEQVTRLCLRLIIGALALIPLLIGLIFLNDKVQSALLLWLNRGIGLCIVLLIGSSLVATWIGAWIMYDPDE
ncbi:hypothetical protein [Actinomadura nitritigenes]|uniref:hypothetical protein n=1 Tax=Actinomadura nitritigenes TaxID=134602 RepID=UPI003D917F51